MAIPERGEWDVEVDGQTYTMKLTMTPARKAQERTKKTIGELYIAADRLDVDAIRTLLWVLCQAYHADKFKTMESVEVFFDWYGGPQAWWDYAEHMGRLASARKAPGEGVAPDNPRQAQAGTGTSSLPPQAASA